MTTLKPKILYVDDEKFNLITFKSEFRKYYEVYTALGPTEGMKILELHEFSVVIADQRMPEMTGVVLLKNIALKFPNIIRMILTGYGDLIEIEEAVKSGIVHKQLNKPWDEVELKDEIDEGVKRFKGVGKSGGIS